jgi:hypothetical protein
MSNSASDEQAPTPDSTPTGYLIEQMSPQAERQFQQLRDDLVASNARLNAKPNLVFAADQEASQFSLSALLGMMAIASLAFTVGRWFDPAVFAGLCGLAAIVYPALLALFFSDRRSSPLAQQGWFLLLLIYLISIMLAIAQKQPG